MRYRILFVLIFSITISSCQVKRTIINISPNLGNPLTLSKDSNYCIETYNQTKEELIIKNKLTNKLKVLGIKVTNDCKYKLFVELIKINLISSKNIPVYFTYDKESNNRKTGKNNYSENSNEWNEVKKVAYNENYKSISLYIDVYDKDNILINSINSFSDKSKREVKSKKNEFELKSEFEFIKKADIKYPIYSSVNEINRNHILELDDKILKAKKSTDKLKILKINLIPITMKGYKISKENIYSRKFYTRRCQQSLDDSVEMMSIQQLYAFLLENSFDKFTSILDIGSNVSYIIWNKEQNKLNYVYFYTSGNSKLYSQYFNPYKISVSPLQRKTINMNQIEYIGVSNIKKNYYSYFCSSKEFKEPNLGTIIDLDDVLIIKSLNNIRINVK